MLLKRVLALLALAFGLLGVVASTAAVYAVWLLGSGLQQANEKVFATIDRGLASSQERVRGVQKRVKESEITTTEVTQKLRDWTATNARERLVSQLDIENRAVKLGGQLRTVDTWLETTTESIRGVQRVLELGNSLSASADSASLGDELTKLEEVQGRLQQAEQTVDGIRAFATVKEGEPEQSRLSRVTKLLGRTQLIISGIDKSLENSAARLAELRTDAQQMKATTSNSIWSATIGCYLLLAWILAGQAALCLCGWSNCCRSRSST